MKKFSNSLLYAAMITFIIGWWAIAFKSPTPKEDVQPIITTREKQIEPPIFSLLSKFDRDQIKKALQGDFPLMQKLIAEWEIDANILESSGLSTIKRLEPNHYLKAQILARKLASNKKLSSYKKTLCRFQDDFGYDLFVSHPPQKFLAQSYAAATFLFALTDPEKIVAIPKHLRRQHEIIPTVNSQKIPLDVDRYHSELIYTAKPDLAFAAPWSHPGVISVLKNQGIPVYILNTGSNLSEIPLSLNKIGEIINEPEKAELLSIFIDAALFAIDNRFSIQSSYMALHFETPRVLYLNYNSRFSTPSTRTLTGKILERMRGFDLIVFNKKISENLWQIPITQEEIVQFHPQCLIVPTPDAKPVHTLISSHPSLHTLHAIAKGNLFFLDDAIQQSPTQFVVLAYFDIYQAVSSTKL